MYLRKYFRRKAFILLFFMLVFGFLGGVILTEFNEVKKIEPAQATFFNIADGTGDNTNGFAWSPNFGWISFNSTDCDLNGDGIFGDPGAPAGCPDASVGFHDYGVNIETGTGVFDGFAWGTNLGWIYFGPDANLGTYGDTLEADAPETPFQWATYDYDTGLVNGWAKALSFGDDGWIKFNGTWSDGVNIDFVSGDMSGFAWSGSDIDNGIGWISFNCLDMPSTCSGGSNPGTLCPNGTECLEGGLCQTTCDLTDYKVTGNVNQIPKAVELEAPFFSNEELCQLGIRNAILKWNFSDNDTGAFETAYQIIFDDDDDPTFPLLNTNKCTFGSTNLSCQISPGVSRYPIHNIIDLEFGKHYYWWVKVWDDYDVASEWATSSDWFADFSIPGHELPIASVDDFKPTLPSAGEEITFEGSSKIFKYSAPGTSIPCENDKINCTWYWDVVPSYYSTINDHATTSPIVVYNNSEIDFFITLSVTDMDGYTCTSTPAVINPNIDLPTWVEIKSEN